MEQINLDFFREPPELDTRGVLTIRALAPLSMVPSQPGYYFRTELYPTKEMLFGLFENALGWHFFDDAKRDNIRSIILKGIAKQAKKDNKKTDFQNSESWLSSKFDSSQSGFKSLLQYHLDFESIDTPEDYSTYDDLWSMSNRTEGKNFIGGSKNYDFRLDDLIYLSKNGINDTKEDGKKIEPPISFGDTTGFKTYSLEELKVLTEGKVKTTSLKPHFPMYYGSPKKRGYIIPDVPYIIHLSCTKALFPLLQQALSMPKAPLYLGTNDGWVEAKLMNL